MVKLCQTGNLYLTGQAPHRMFYHEGMLYQIWLLFSLRFVDWHEYKSWITEIYVNQMLCERHTKSSWSVCTELKQPSNTSGTNCCNDVWHMWDTIHAMKRWLGLHSIKHKAQIHLDRWQIEVIKTLINLNEEQSWITTKLIIWLAY